MRQYPIDNYGKEEVKEMKAEQWQINCLKFNPNYTSWGNFEDYMKDEKNQWDSPVVLDSVNDLWELDELNELINFYFKVHRKSVCCVHCDGTRLNEETKKINNDWYTHLRTDGKKGWSINLTEIEIKELVKHGRLNDLLEVSCYYDNETNKWIGLVNGQRQEIDEPKYPTPQEVNTWAKKGIRHDSINRDIAVKARATHLGVYGLCEHCNGKGYIYTEPNAKLSLQMWFIHPRKGASRGVYLKEIKQDELPIVIDYLRQAKYRNIERFSKL